jgi:hypothetical protein
MYQISNKFTRTVALTAILFAVAVVIQLVVLKRISDDALNYTILPWDDAVYVTRALENVDFVTNPNSSIDSFQVHAPLADIQVFLTALIAGDNIFAIYFSNFVFILIALLVFVQYCRRLPVTTTISLILFFALFPPLQMITDELKSDYKGALIFSLTLLLLFSSKSSYSTGRAFTTGLLFFVAAAGKFTAFFLPFVIAFVYLLSVFSHFDFRGYSLSPLNYNYTSINRRILVWHRLSLSIFLLFYFMQLLFQFDTLSAYVYEALSSKWNDGFSFTERVFYYSPFLDTGGNWGLHFVITLILTFYFFIFTNASSTEKRMLYGLLSLNILLFVILLIPKTHNPSFGAYFSFSCLATGTFLLRSVLINSKISPVLFIFWKKNYLRLEIPSMFLPKTFTNQGKGKTSFLSLIITESPTLISILVTTDCLMTSLECGELMS